MWPEDGVFVHEIIHCAYDLLYITASFWEQHTVYNFKKVLLLIEPAVSLPSVRYTQAGVFGVTRLG